MRNRLPPNPNLLPSRQLSAFFLPFSLLARFLLHAALVFYVTQASGIPGAPFPLAVGVSRLRSGKLRKLFACTYVKFAYAQGKLLGVILERSFRDPRSFSLGLSFLFMFYTAPLVV